LIHFYKRNIKIAWTMKIVGTVLKTKTTFVNVLEVGSTQEVCLYGRGNEGLKIGNLYEFTNLEDGGRPLKSFKTTERTKATSLGPGNMIKIEGTVVRASNVKVELVGGKQSMCIYGRGYEHLSVGEVYEFSNIVEESDQDQQQVKVYRITARTVVVKIKREKVTPRVEESASISTHTAQSQRAKQNEPERRMGTNTQSTSSQSNSKKGSSRRAMSGGMQGKTRFFSRQKGKTYRKSWHDSPVVDMNDTKWKGKLDRWKRRDTKCGGLSRSSRVRRDPRNLRLGSDRFSRPRPDRIYNVEDTDDEETYYER